MHKPTDDARTRLQAAAMDLFVREGFERVTAAQIAAHAGVTERTFFRHFPDKREVLFDGETVVRATLTDAVATGPRELGPIDILRHAFLDFVPRLEAKRLVAKPRHDLIASTPALHERELLKIDTLSTALSEALRSRGIGKRNAVLAAQIGLSAFMQASHAWMDDPTKDLAALIDEAFADVKTLIAPPG